MRVNAEAYEKVKNDYALKREKAQADLDARRIEVEEAVPEMRKIEKELSGSGLKILDAALSGSKARMDEVKAENLLLQKKRKDLLKEAGYPADFLEIKYSCPDCKDTGYVGIVMCKCMRRALVKAGIEASGLASLLPVQTFDSFSLKYYRNNAEASRRAEHALATMKAYAENFSFADGKAPENLLLVGATGLGKTHLTTAAAGVIIEKGYDVRYICATDLISVFERERFGRAQEDAAPESDTYLDCELLIVDDLGTEVSNQYTVSVIYNLINSRLNRKLPTIINTNLNAKEIKTRYDDRITSRLLGDYLLVMFSGTDIRMQKLKESSDGNDK